MFSQKEEGLVSFCLLRHWFVKLVRGRDDRFQSQTVSFKGLVSFLSLALVPGHTSFTDSDSKEKVCFFGAGSRDKLSFFGPGFRGKICYSLAQVAEPRCASITGSTFRARVGSFHDSGFRTRVGFFVWPFYPTLLSSYPNIIFLIFN